MRSHFLSTVALLATPLLSSPTPGNNDPSCVYPGQSIQDAIDKAHSGDQITVEKGTYAEQLTIKKDGITLIGNGAVLVPPKTFGKNSCSGLSKDLQGNDTEAGICIQGDVQLATYVKEHRRVTGVSNYIRGVTVTGFEVRGFNGENIAVLGGQDTVIKNNHLVDGGQYGFLTVGSKHTIAARNKVETVSFPIGFIAMCMDDQSDTKFRENNVSGYFVGLCTQTNGGVQKRNTVTNCCVGPYVDPGVTGAKIIGNNISGHNAACPTASADGPGVGVGIIIDGATNTLVQDNTISHTTFGSSGSANDTGVGIFINDNPDTGKKATGNIIKHNTFEANDFDIFNNATSTDNVIQNNACTAAKTAPGTGYCG